MDCTEVSPACPVSDTIYGYYPNLAGNAFLASIFGICAIVQVMLGVKYRVVAYTVLVVLGCIGEVVGYIGRLMLHANPWNSGALSIQILLLIVSPSFLAASLYLTLKHLILHFGPQYSRMKPKLYTWVFITCDAIGFLTQLVGGGIEAASKTENTKNVGNAIMIAGIVFQAITMGVCATLAVDYTVQMLHFRGGPRDIRVTRAFGFYLGCAVTAFAAILIRCIYRIPEMAGGWSNPIMRNQAAFMILDGSMIATGTILMTVGFPGAFFPEISIRSKCRQKLLNEETLNLRSVEHE